MRYLVTNADGTAVASFSSKGLAMLYRDVFAPTALVLDISGASYPVNPVLGDSLSWL